MNKLKGAKERTLLGLRALYVRVRRSYGIPDNQIAWEINHTLGDRR
jgi:hypothetical protein